MTTPTLKNVLVPFDRSSRRRALVETIDLGA
jgi:hypothetical protein